MKKFNQLKFFILIFGFLLPTFSMAQVVPDSLSINLSPSNPMPGETVSASISAFEFNVDLAKIVWSLDGKIIKQGQGQKNVSVKAPSSSSKTSTLSVEVTPPGRPAISSSVSISPSGSLDIIFEAVDSYTPPFYRGKALPIKQGAIKVVAMPVIKTSTGALVKPSGFAYTWKKDGKNMPSQSGIGKNSFAFINEILDPNNRLEVSATNGIETVQGSITINPSNPEIIFYEYDQIKSMPGYQKAFTGNFSINQPRISLVAEPYFLVKNWRESKNVVFSWKLNNQPANAIDKNNLGVITTTKGNIGVDVEYNETNKMFRNIKSSINFTVR